MVWNRIGLNLLHHDVARFDVDRREFFRFLGAGVLIICVMKIARALQESGAGGQGAQGASLPKEIGAWLHIGEDGGVTVYTGKVEMGQKYQNVSHSGRRRRVACSCERNPDGDGRYQAHTL